MEDFSAETQTPEEERRSRRVVVRKRERELRKVWEAARKEAGITSRRFHDLRHTFATRMADAAMEMQELAKILGHTDISMTYRYYPDEEGEGQNDGHTQQTCSDVGEMAELRDFIFIEIPNTRVEDNAQTGPNL